MLIAQMTDIHIGFDPDAKPDELNRIRFRQTLARMLKAPNTPDMLVLTGDLTDRGDVLNDADFIVDVHDRYDRSVVSERRFESVHIEQAIFHWVQVGNFKAFSL